MMVRDFKPEDLAWLELQRAQRMWLGVHTPTLDAEYGEGLVAAGPCWTVADDDGWIVAACGFNEIFPTYATAWSLLAEGLGHRHLGLTRMVRERMAAAPYARIEALIRADFPPASKWAGMVGLSPVTLLRKAGPMLEDYILFERVN
jgi:hypothetical protein